MISVSIYLCFYTHSCSGATDRAGKTPLDLATQEGHTEIADYLKSLPQQCKLTRIMSTQCGPIQLLSLYTAAVTGDTDSRSDENGPPPTKKRKSNYYLMCTYILIHLYVPVSHTHTTPTLTHTHTSSHHTHTRPHRCPASDSESVS